MSLNDTMFKQPLALAPRAVLFDLDDTLYPERQYVFSGFQAVAAHIQRVYGLLVFNDLVQIYLAGERANVFGATLEKHFGNVEEAVLKKVLHVFWTHTPKIQLYEDARICMALLFSRAIKVGVITTGRGGIQQKKIAALELEPLLDGIIYTDDLLNDAEPGQPNADAFHILALQLEVELSELCFVGDNPLTDFAIPRRLGVKTVRIRRPGGEFSEAQPPALGFQADRVIESLTDLPRLFLPANSPKS
ncbi:MAG: HAD family hydrolase [Kiritimatiellae bacterium]|nr:HAD family hydrolase [Kiritimatiellia bacterium]